MRRLYTTIDVTFLEIEMFFISRDTQSSLQGETRNEDHNWVLENWINWDSEGQIESDKKGNPDGQRDDSDKKGNSDGQSDDSDKKRNPDG